MARKSVEDRFLEKIEVMPNGCWFWRASTDSKGYGYFKLNNRMHRAHCVAWMFYRGEIPKDMYVMHTCETNICANPEHLYLGNAVTRCHKAVRCSRDCKQRLLEKIAVVGTCWIWQGHTNRGGYGTIGASGDSVLAHRVSWNIFRGKIPENLYVLHRCDTPACINPEHLFLGTYLDNAIDREQKGRGRQPRGEAHARAAFTEEQVRYVIAVSKQLGLRRGWQTRLAEELGVSHSAIQHVVHGRCWSWLNNELAKAKDSNNKRANSGALQRTSQAAARSPGH